MDEGRGGGGSSGSEGESLQSDSVKQFAPEMSASPLLRPSLTSSATEGITAASSPLFGGSNTSTSTNTSSSSSANTNTSTSITNGTSRFSNRSAENSSGSILVKTDFLNNNDSSNDGCDDDGSGAFVIDEYELPDDFNPFDLEFTTLDPAKETEGSPSSPSEAEDPDEDSQKITLKTSIYLDHDKEAINDEGAARSIRTVNKACNTSKKTKIRKLNVDFVPYKEDEEVSDSDSDAVEDPTFDDRNRLCCPLCNFKTKSKSCYHNHILTQHNNRASKRKRIQTDRFRSPVTVPSSVSSSSTFRPSHTTFGVPPLNRCSSGKRTGGIGSRGPYKKRGIKQLLKKMKIQSSLGLGVTSGGLLSSGLTTPFSRGLSASSLTSSGEGGAPQRSSDQENTPEDCYDPSIHSFSCGKCPFITANLKSFRTHSYAHPKDFSCQHCTYMTNNETKFNKHRETHSDLRKMRCPHCGFSTTNERYFKVHKAAHKVHKAHTSTNNKKTNKRTNSKVSALKLHKYKCNKCNFVSLNYNSYKSHMATHGTPVAS